MKKIIFIVGIHLLLILNAQSAVKKYLYFVIIPEDGGVVTGQKFSVFNAQVTDTHTSKLDKKKYELNCSYLTENKIQLLLLGE